MATEPAGQERARQRFVIDHGHRARAEDIAFILACPVEDVVRLRAMGACSKGGPRRTFAELFSLWHGREAADDEWPPPRKRANGGYEWQGREVALLASLTGRLGVEQISRILSERLRQVTGDPAAERGRQAVQNAISRIGLQSKDVVGGITIAEAGHEIGSLATVHQAVHKGDLRAHRVGRLWVIARGAWGEWKAKRVFPPPGYLPLATLKQPLGIQSDKLSEFARMGYVPTAVRCNPYGGGRSTQFGTWFIDPATAEKLVADRRAGRPMPWHGKPSVDNLRATYRLWQQRKHPEQCAPCAAIWGPAGAPRSFEDYAGRYPQLAHGAKRHLTRPWTPGLTVTEVAEKAGCTVKLVRRAITNGTLAASNQDGKAYVTRTDATRWISRGRPTGDKQRSWMSVATAGERYLFSEQELESFIARGQLRSKVGKDGAMRGIVYVFRQQCADLRETIGFTEHEAAARAGLSIEAFRVMLEDLDWRGTGGIPLTTVQAVIKRRQSRHGTTIDEAASALGQDPSWVQARVNDGTVRLRRTRWAPSRVYLSEPMMRRLRKALVTPQQPVPLPKDWLRLSKAAAEAGVTAATIIAWGKAGELERIHAANGWKYRRASVRARARLYWQTVRFRRATPPPWLHEHHASD